jgi:hypothetical protein
LTPAIKSNFLLQNKRKMKFIAPTAAVIGSVLLLAPTKIEALCAAFVKYDACSTKAAYAMAACNNLVRFFSHQFTL